MAAARPYTLGEEIANSVTHGIGVTLAVAGLTLLTADAARFGNGWHLASALVFGLSLLLLYVASTLYHAFPWPRVKRVFRVLDHGGTYLLIAGTYTPFTLVTLRGRGGLALFAVIWALALAAVAVEVAWVNRPRWLGAALGLGMGWLVATSLGPLAEGLRSPGLGLLIAGGIAYSAGTVFYVLRQVPYLHSVWHGFVLAGSVCHFLSVFLGVIPRG